MKKENLIIIIVLVLFGAGFLIFKNPGQAQKEDPHRNVGSMSDAMNQLNNLPDDYESLVKMGNDFMDDRNYPVAAECYRRALAIDGSSNNVRTDFGACLHGMGLPQRALQEFRTVYEEQPEHPVVNFNLGIVFHDLGMPDSTRYYWQRYLVLEPEGEVADAVREFLDRPEGS